MHQLLIEAHGPEQALEGLAWDPGWGWSDRTLIWVELRCRTLTLSGGGAHTKLVPSSVCVLKPFVLAERYP